MGLFDGLSFSPDGYQSGGGLLDLLKNYQAMANVPALSQSQGAPMPDRMMQIGQQQFPQFGPQGDPSQLPANAQPIQGSLPNAQAAPQQAAQPLPPALGGNQSGSPIADHLVAGLQGLTNSKGILPALTNAFTGFATGQRNDPVGLQQQNLKAQYDSLVPILGPQKALLAVMNPEAGKTLLTEALTNKEDLKIIKDEFGAEHPYWSNVRDQTLRPALAQGSSGAGVSGSMQDTISKLGNMPGATLDDRLGQVPEAYRGYVKSLLAGQALPSNIGRSQLRGPIMTLAHAVDPTFDEATIPLRFKTATDYAPNGQSGRSIVALNTVQHHIGKLSDDLENLGDTGWTWINAVRNGIAQNTPLDKKQGVAAQAVQDDLKAVTDEMSAAYKAGRVSDHEIEAWNKLANANLPVRQLKQGISDFVGLLNGKRDQLNETHQQILGREAPGINKELNTAITQKVTARNSDNPAAQASATTQYQEGQTATNPQTGQKLTFRNGKWQ